MLTTNQNPTPLPLPLATQTKQVGKRNILIIDNYDSYTYNLLALLSSSANVTIIKNDSITTSTFLTDWLPYLDGIVVSPGPGKPDNYLDFGISLDIFKLRLDIPILGVCLGHQGLAYSFGTKVVKGCKPMHGLVTQVQTTAYGRQDPLFYNFSDSFKVTRYHSLVVDFNTLSDQLKVSCIANDGDGEVIMGLAHATLPYFSIQFHPESIESQFGQKLMDNFLEICRSHTNPYKAELRSNSSLPTILNNCNEPIPITTVSYNNQFKVRIAEVDVSDINLEYLFENLFQPDKNQADHCFWLDSNGTEVSTDIHSKVYSYLGRTQFNLHYSLKEDRVHAQHTGTDTNLIDTCFKDGELDFWAWFSNLYETLKLNPNQLESLNEDKTGFLGGFVGYFSYEMKHKTLAKLPTNSICTEGNRFADAQFMFVDKLVSYDHSRNKLKVVGIINNQLTDIKGLDWSTGDGNLISTDLTKVLGCTDQDFQMFFDTVQTICTEYQSVNSNYLFDSRDRFTNHPEVDLNTCLQSFNPDLKDLQYLDTIQKCKAKILEGESYELCLTTQYKSQIYPEAVKDRSFELYKRLRSYNKASYSAFLKFSDVHVLSTSPERFFKLNGSEVSMKPIKGTLKKAVPTENERNDPIRLKQIYHTNVNLIEQLQTDVKQRAENLMIVDLIRNDLFQVSDPDSVQVPKLMQVESLSTVHQLVTTVQATLKPKFNAVDLVKKTFPPGSMTGAPKLRSVEILQQLEPKLRGIYSGCLGYLSLNGDADFNVVIRTITVQPASTNSTSHDCHNPQEEDEGRNTNKAANKGQWAQGVQFSAGAGGAIIHLSDTAEELDEMKTKLLATLPKLKGFLDSV